MRDDDQIDDPENAGESARERVSLDEPSRFTLTGFRRSKVTRFFLWLFSLLSLGSGF